MPFFPGFWPNINTIHQALGLLKPSAGQHAYLDPGSGSFLLQLLVAALLGGLFLLRSYWGKVASFFRKILKRQDSPEDDE